MNMEALIGFPKLETKDLKDGGEVEIIPSKPRDLIYIHNCEGTHFTINGKAAKAIVDGCKDCTVVVKNSFITSTVEVLRCNGVTMVYEANVATTVVDGCEATTLNYTCGEAVDPASVVAAASTGTTVSANGGEPAAVPCSSTSATTQTLARYNAADTAWDVAQVVREGAGYITTASDKAEADAREERALAQFQHAMKHGPPGAKRVPGSSAPSSSGGLSSGPGRRAGGSALGGGMMSGGGMMASSRVGGGATAKLSANARASGAGPASTAAGGAAGGTGAGGVQPRAPMSMLSSIRRFDKSDMNEVDKNINGEEVIVSKGRASYQIADDEDKNEYFDSPEEVDAKTTQLAELIRAAKYMVAYTGAGISTAADIPDFRGPQGIWTMRSQGKHATGGVSMGDAVPTLTHNALTALAAADILKAVVTTNGDDLHRKSGLPKSKCVELHGNIRARRCPDCENEYYRSPETSCTECNVPLRSSGVAFGSNLPKPEIDAARGHTVHQDLALVMGTSMRVSPAANLPESSYKNGGHLVIVNLQKTPYDKYATLVIRAKTDEVMEAVMTKLGALDDAVPAAAAAPAPAADTNTSG